MSYLEFTVLLYLIISYSLIYEWIEWFIAMGLSPEDAENYNGQQGDIWDAHQDMLLATVGTIITGIACLLKK